MAEASDSCTVSIIAWCRDARCLGWHHVSCIIVKINDMFIHLYDEFRCHLKVGFKFTQGKIL